MSLPDLQTIDGPDQCLMNQLARIAAKHIEMPEQLNTTVYFYIDLLSEDFEVKATTDRYKYEAATSMPVKSVEIDMPWPLSGVKEKMIDKLEYAKSFHQKYGNGDLVGFFESQIKKVKAVKGAL